MTARAVAASWCVCALLAAQSPYANAPVALELRTNDASFAAVAQRTLRSVARDPRSAGNAGSIRVCLRYLAKGVQGVAEEPLSSGRRLNHRRSARYDQFSHCS
jgi:hypothetical protein